MNVKIFESHKASMEIEGCSLQKEKPDNYSFYFDNDFLKAYISGDEKLKGHLFPSNTETSIPKSTVEDPQI